MVGSPQPFCNGCSEWPINWRCRRWSSSDRAGTIGNMHDKDSGSGRMNRGLTDSERDALMTQPTVFAPGEDKLSEQALRALSPQEMLWRHRSVAGLSEALIMMVDDEMLNIEMTQAFLVEAGYQHFVQTDRPELAAELKDLWAVAQFATSRPRTTSGSITVPPSATRSRLLRKSRT